MLVLQILIVLIGLYIIRIYLPPLVSLGELNLGNLFGYVAGFGIIVFGIFLNAIVCAVKSGLAGDHKKQVIITLVVICTVIIAFLAAFFGTLGSIVSASHQTATDQTTVIVLGCRIKGDVPSGSLKNRCSAAARYLEENPDAVVIASGGQGKDENLSEGQCIHDLLVEKGIDESRIFIEDKSHSTDENIANSLKIIEDNNLSTDVAIATSDYHEKRARIICKKNGLTPYSVPANSTKWAKPTQFTREVFGVWVQAVSR